MAVININSGGPEGKEREFGLTWSSDLPSVRKPYTRKAHIPEDDVVFGGGDGSLDYFVSLNVNVAPNVISGDSVFRIHIPDKDGEVIEFAFLLSTYDISGVTNIEFYVPADLVDDYKAATGWSDYAGVIFAEPEEEETQEETPGEP